MLYEVNKEILKSEKEFFLEESSDEEEKLKFDQTDFE